MTIKADNDKGGETTKMNGITYSFGWYMNNDSIVVLMLGTNQEKRGIKYYEDPTRVRQSLTLNVRKLPI